jgi:hypothetical protein
MPNKSWISRVQTIAAAPVGGLDLPLWIVTGLGVFAISIVFNAFGLLHFELFHYISYHLGPGPALKKIFDNRVLDAGIYEGRELSYLIDHFDVLLVALSVKWGCPMFISTTHVALCIFIGVWIGWFAAKDLGLGSLIGLLLALLFWTAPFVYLHFLLRTAKVLTAAALVTLIVEIYRAFVRQREEPGRWLQPRSILTIMASAWVLCFADRQGLFFLASICLLMAIQWTVNRDRVAGRILGLLAAVLTLELVYFFWIAPALTKAFFGYDPDFSFNRLPFEELFQRPGYFAGQALALLIETCGLVLGRIPRWAVALVLAVFLGIALAHDQKLRSWRDRLPLTGLVAAALAALLAMYTLMILRFPLVLWTDIRLVYYWIPTGALIVLGTAAVFGGWAGQGPWRKTALAGVLLAMVLRNTAALPEHRKVFAAGHLRPYVELTPEIRDALVHHDDPYYQVSSEVDEIPAYRALVHYVHDSDHPVVRRAEFGIGTTNRFARNRLALTVVSGEPVPFVWRFGGNVDSRHLSTSAELLETGDKRGFIGGAEGWMEMRVNLATNRLQGEVLVLRTDADVARPMWADFAIYAQPDKANRYPRWSTRVHLPVGQKEVRVPYAIDSSHLPTTFTLNIPAGLTGKIAAGWRVPYITDVGGDSPEPEWLNRSDAPAVVLDEAALHQLLPDEWRPLEARMRNGRVTNAGVELLPEGEIWFHVRGIVSKFIGISTVVTSGVPAHRPEVNGFWYKAGRLDAYASPAPESTSASQQFFQAWCGEPGGWLVIAVDTNPTMSPVAVRVTEVTQHY